MRLASRTSCYCLGQPKHVGLFWLITLMAWPNTLLQQKCHRYLQPNLSWPTDVLRNVPVGQRGQRMALVPFGLIWEDWVREGAEQKCSARSPSDPTGLYKTRKPLLRTVRAAMKWQGTPCGLWQAVPNWCSTAFCLYASVKTADQREYFYTLYNVVSQIAVSICSCLYIMMMHFRNAISQNATMYQFKCCVW